MHAPSCAATTSSLSSFDRLCQLTFPAAELPEQCQLCQQLPTSAFYSFMLRADDAGLSEVSAASGRQSHRRAEG